jgi:hypothetical protein
VLAPDDVLATVYAAPIAFIVLRTILGFSPPEWAYVTGQRTGAAVPQGRCAASIVVSARTR